MTLTIEKILGNLFDDKSISNPRLGNFGSNSLERFKAMNTKGDLKGIIDIIEVPLTNFLNESGNMSLSQAQRRGLTITTNMVMDNLHDTMSEKHAELAFKLGGEKAIAMLEFFPHGLTEYLNATKEQMPMITSRLAKAAMLHTVALGKDLTDLLKGFETLWNNARNNQTDKKAEESSHRNERSNSRLALELALTQAIHFIGNRYPGDVEMAKNFFEFHLLYYTQPAKKEEQKP